MVRKFCELWKILWELVSSWAKFCEILSRSVRYDMYATMSSAAIRLWKTYFPKDVTILLDFPAEFPTKFFVFIFLS